MLLRNSFVQIMVGVLALTWFCACVGRSDTGASPIAGTVTALSPNTIAADGEAQATVDVWLRDADGTAIQGATVTLIASDSLVLNQPTQPTDRVGHASASVAGLIPGKYSIGLSVFVGGLNLLAPQPVFVTLSASERSYGNRLLLEVNPSSASVDTAPQRTVRATLVAATGETLAGQSIEIRSSRPSDRFLPPSGITDEAGRFETVLASTAAGQASLTASSADVSSPPVPALFLAGAPDIAHTFFLTQQGNQIIADGVVANDAQVFVGDQYGNPVPAAPITLTSSDPNVMLNPPGGQANADGVFVTHITSTALGALPIGVAVGSGVGDYNVVRVAGAASARASSLVLSPNTLIADNNSVAYATLSLRDAAGHPRVGDTVLFSSSTASTQLSRASSATDANGEATVALSSTTSGTVTITAQGNALVLSAPLTFTSGPIDLSRCSFVLSANSAVADSNSALVAILSVYDAFLNPVGGVSVAFSSPDAGDTLVPAAGTTGAEGIVTTQWRSDHAAPHLLTASFANDTRTAQANFVAGPPAAATSNLLLTPNVVVAGNVLVASVYLADASGNPTGNQLVTIAGGNGCVWSPNVAATTSQGYALFSAQQTQAQSAFITAEAGNLLLGASASVVAGAPNASLSSMRLSPNAVVAGAVSVAQVSVADAYANPVVGVPVSLGGAAQLVSDGPRATDAMGLSVLSAQTTMAQNVLLTSQLGNVTLAQAWRVLPGALSPNGSAFAVSSPNAVTANGVATLSFSGRLGDVFGNPIANQNYTLQPLVPRYVSTTYTINGGVVQTNFRVSVNGALQPANTYLFNSGSWGSGWTPSNVSQLFVRPGTNSLAFADVGAYVNLDFFSVSRGDMFLSVEAESQPIDGSASVASSTAGYTGAGYVVLGGGVAGGITSQYFSQAVSPNAFLSVRFLSNATANCSVTVNNNITTTYNLGAGDNVTWAISRPMPLALQSGNNTIRFSSNSTQILVDQLVFVSRGPSTIIEAESGVLSGGAAVQSGGSASNNAYVNSFGNGRTDTVSYLAPTEAITPLSGLSDSNGLFSGTWSSTTAETKQLVLSAGNITVSSNFVFSPNVPAISKSTLVLSPKVSVVAGAPLTVGLQVSDSLGNPVVGAGTSFSAAAALSAQGPNQMLADALGWSSAVYTASSTGNYTVCGQAGPYFSLCANVGVIAGAPNAALSTVSVTPASLVAGSNATLAVTLRDRFGNASPNATIMLGGGSNLVVLQSFGSTNAAGQSNAMIRTTLAQNTVLTVQSSGITLFAPFPVIAAAPNASLSTLTLSPNAGVAADMNSAITVRATIRDTYGNPVAGQTLHAAAQFLRYLGLRYSSGDPGVGTTQLTVNGSVLTNYQYPMGTGGPVPWAYASTTPLILQSANNTLTFSSGGGCENFDFMTFSAGDSSQIVEAEQQSLGNGATLASATAGYTGTGYVVLAASGASVVAQVVGSGTSPMPYMGLRYSNAATQNVLVSVNGGANTVLHLGATSVGTWRLSPVVPLALQAGNNIVGVAGLGSTVFVDEVVIIQRGVELKVEAESGVVSGSAHYSTNYPGYSGSGFVDNICNFSSAITITVPLASETIPAVASTDANGQWITPWSSSVAESKTLGVSMGNLVLTANATFVPGPPSAATSQLAVGSNATVAGGALVSVAVRIFDAQLNAVGNTLVSFVDNASPATFQPSTSATNAMGVAWTAMRGTVAGQHLVCAQAANNVTLCQNVTVVAGAPNATLSSFGVAPNAVTAGGPVSHTGIFVDAYGNICAGQSAVLSDVLNGNVVAGPATTALGAQGNLTLSLGPSASGNYAALANVGGTLFQANFVINANVATQLLITNLQSLPAGLVSDINVVVADMYSNLVQPSALGTLSLVSTDAQAVLAAPYTLGSGDNSAHLFVGGVQSFTQGVQTVTVSLAGGANLIASASTSVLPPIVAPVQAVLLGSSPNQCLRAAGGSSAANTSLGADLCVDNLYHLMTRGSDQSLRTLNQCVQPLNKVLVAGQNLVISACDQSLAQRWQPSGSMLVNVANANFCIDGVAAAAGGQATLVSCGSPNAASFVLRESSRSINMAYDNSSQQIVFSPNSTLGQYYNSWQYPLWFSGQDEVRGAANQCLSTNSPSVVAGVQVLMAPCNGGGNQQWRVSGNKLLAKADPNLCFDGGQTPPGLIACPNASGSSSFSMVSCGYGMQMMPLSSLGLCLQTTSYPAAAAGNIVLAACNQSPQQMLSVVGRSNIYNFPYVVMNLGDANYPYISFGAGGGNQVGQSAWLNYGLYQNVTNIQPHYFMFSDYSSGGTHLVSSGSPQLFLQADANSYAGYATLGPYSVAPVREFTFQTRPAQVAQSAGNLCLSATGGNAYYNQRVVWSTCAQAPNQKMFFPYTMGSSFAPTTSMPIAFNGLCLASTAGGAAGTSLVMTTCDYTAGQTWQVGRGPLALKNAAGVCVDASTASAGGNVVLQSCSGASSQNVTVSFF